MYTYRVTKVNRVVDGDTVDITIDLGFDIHYKARVRMYGINAPESRTRDLEEKKRGLAAKDRLVELLAVGDVTIKTSKDKTGKFGRLLGELFVAGVNINEQLIEEGHGVPYFGGKR
jgi:micrococcal nuclease